MDGGDGPHIRPRWQHRLRHMMENIAHHARIGAGMIVWLQFIIANGLENEAVLIAVVDENLANGEGIQRAGPAAAAAVEPQIDMVVNQLLRAAARPQVDMEVNRPVEAAVEPQVDVEVNRPVEAAAEPQVDVEVNRPVEAEDPLPGGSSRSLSDAVSDSDDGSDAEEEDPASVPSSSPVPGGSRKRSREEEDEADEMSAKRIRCLSNAVSDSDDGSDAEEDDPASARSSCPVPGGSRKRSREEDDEGNERSSKQFRH